MQKRRRYVWQILPSRPLKRRFLQLLNEKPLNKISVRDIVEKCGINRNSFYYHFQDIPSLIAEIITAYTDRLIEEYPTISTLDECCEMAFPLCAAQPQRRDAYLPLREP